MISLEREECLRLLAETHLGRLAMAGPSEAPLIRPVSYVFDDRSQSIVFRTSPGSNFHMLTHAPAAAFEIDGVDPATHIGWSVIVSGVAEQVTTAGERDRLDALGLDTWAPGARPHWMRLRARTVSGRRIMTANGGVPKGRVAELDLARSGG